jgi:hypothetical protein
LTQKTITEPAREVPLYGEYEVAVLGGGPAGIAAAVAAARAARRTLLIERYGFLGGMGTAAGVTNFCGLHANVFGEARRVVQGVASDLLARIDRLGGLNAPHLILGKILAQAYDTAAYKIAADDLLAAHKVDILFHALGAGVVMQASRASTLMVETKPGGRRCDRTSSSTAPATAIAAWAGARFEVGDNAGGMLYPSMMFRLNGIDPKRPATPGGRSRRDEAAKPRYPSFSAQGRDRAAAALGPNGGSISADCRATTAPRSTGSPDDLTRGEVDGRRQAVAAISCARCRV